MKLLYIIDTLQQGGTEKSLLELATEFKRTEALIYHIYEGDALRSQFERKGIRVISGNLKARHAYGKAIRNTLRLIRSEKPDLIHTSLARANFVGRISGLISNVPVISSFVNDSYSETRFLHSDPSIRRKLKVTKILDRLTSKCVVHFVSNSQTVKDSNCSCLGISPQRVSVIYRGRNPSPFISTSLKQLHELRESLGIDSKIPVVLNVGRLHSQKGQKDLVRSMELVNKKVRSHLVIAGEGPLRDELTRLIRNLGLERNITLLGTRNDIPLLLNVAAVFAFPSYYEGHAGAVVEAMFAARPIVLSDIASNRETIIEGETGYLVPPGDPLVLAERLTYILNHPEEAKRIGQNAREAAMRKFHIDDVSARYEDLYEEVLRRWRNS